MKYSLVLAALLGVVSLHAATESTQTQTVAAQSESITAPTTSTINVKCPANAKITAEKKSPVDVLQADKDLLISVVGQGVAPVNTTSPAQAYALAKRAAVADAYRLIAEKVKGVRVDGQDLIKNMMVQRSTVRTSVQAIVRNANIAETTFKEGLCEVEMEIVLSHAQFQ